MALTTYLLFPTPYFETNMNPVMKILFIIGIFSVEKRGMSRNYI